ncbi:hypothetical protein BLOT_015571 [Blomia tropicalis]|nr:hypothetical protein BLOT_015571 [Blomia tropicalis]
MKPIDVRTLPTIVIVRQSYFCARKLTTGPGTIENRKDYIKTIDQRNPVCSEPIHAVVALFSLNSAEISGSRNPNENMIPSTMTLHMNDANTTAHPNPPASESEDIRTSASSSFWSNDTKSNE